MRDRRPAMGAATVSLFRANASSGCAKVAGRSAPAIANSWTRRWNPPAPNPSSGNLIEFEPHLGFQTSFGRGDSCTRYQNKRCGTSSLLERKGRRALRGHLEVVGPALSACGSGNSAPAFRESFSWCRIPRAHCNDPLEIAVDSRQQRRDCRSHRLVAHENYDRYRRKYQRVLSHSLTALRLPHFYERPD